MKPLPFPIQLVLPLFLLLVTSGHWIQPASLSGQDWANYATADTSSPQATLKSLLDGCNEVYRLIQRDQYIDRDDVSHAYIRMQISDCLDTSTLPGFSRDERAGEVAICIKEILDREEIPPWDQIPDIAQVEQGEGIVNWRIPKTRITISRIESGPRKHEYLISADTVDRAVDYFRQIQSKPYRTDGPETSPGLYNWYMSAPGDPWVAAIVSRLPEQMRLGRSFGLANWKWPGLLIVLFVAGCLMLLTYRLYAKLVNRVRGKSNFKYSLTIVFPLIGVLIPLAFNSICRDHITIRGTPLYILSFVAVATTILASIVLVFAAVNRIAETVIASPRIDPQGLNAQLIRIASRLIGLTTSAIVLLAGGQYLGIPIATLLASAGIGGVAIALGAQDTLKTLFGTITLMADKPFRVGERIVVGNYDGVVEDIGLRSTRLRLLNGHLVTLPNDLLSRSNIENVGRRQFIRRDAEILIPLDTNREKIEQAVQIVREKLADHEGMNEDYPPRVFFSEFGSNAFRVQFIYWYSPPNYWDFKAFGDRVNFEILSEFEAQGIPFSLPIRHSFWKQDKKQGPLDVRITQDEQTSP